MKTHELDFTLPEELIAQHPCTPRDASRLLVVDRSRGTFALDVFSSLPGYLEPGDCLVMNDTRVVRARLRATKPTGAQIELFLLREEEPGVWIALVRPSAKVPPGSPVNLAGGIRAHIEDRLPEGRRRVRFDQPDVLPLLERLGEVPLPPYIHRDTPDPEDIDRYQTVFARADGAVAAPTAGLHYTPDLFKRLDDMGVARCMLTLHVGYGTFKPVTADNLEDHTVDAEWFDLPHATAAQLNKTRERGGRIVAVGTTSTRVLETQADEEGRIVPGSGFTTAYIYPPYRFRAVDALQTNFHLPRSSLLALVHAFGGSDLIRKAYERAVAERFRFYSYGDAMLLL